MRTPTATRRRKASTLAEIRRQRAQLVSACWRAVQVAQDAAELIENGDRDGARVALSNLVESVRADLTGARARP